MKTLVQHFGNLMKQAMHLALVSHLPLLLVLLTRPLVTFADVPSHGSACLERFRTVHALEHFYFLLSFISLVIFVNRNLFNFILLIIRDLLFLLTRLRTFFLV